jgi:hypothetical protein
MYSFQFFCFYNYAAGAVLQGLQFRADVEERSNLRYTPGLLRYSLVTGKGIASFLAMTVLTESLLLCTSPCSGEIIRP